MKLLFTTLGIFILFLSCVPCSDKEECTTATIETVINTGGHEQHSHESESCTPLCTCACCAVSVSNSPISKIQVNAIPSFSQQHILLDVAFDAEAHYSIWELPQLAC